MVAPVGTDTVLYAVVKEFAFQYGLQGNDFKLATQEFARLIQMRSALDAGSLLAHGFPAVDTMIAYTGATGKDAAKIALALIATANIGSSYINFRDRGHYLMEVGRTFSSFYDPSNAIFLPRLGINLDSLMQKPAGDRFSYLVMALRLFRLVKPDSFERGFGYLYAVTHLLDHFEDFDLARVGYDAILPSHPKPQIVAAAEFSGNSYFDDFTSIGIILTRGITGFTLFPPILSNGYISTGHPSNLAQFGKIGSSGRIKVEVRIAGISQFGLLTAG